MGVVEFQITGNAAVCSTAFFFPTTEDSAVCSTVFSYQQHKKRQISASLVFCYNNSSVIHEFPQQEDSYVETLP